MRKVFLTILLLFSILPASAEWADEFRYKYYGTSEGLCDEYATATLMDREGYLWICTSNGLDRFDGHRFVHFNSQSSDPSTRISNNHIYNIVEDGFGNLWAVSNTGIFKIDKKKKSIELPDKFGYFVHILDQQMLGITKEDDQTLWLLKNSSLVRVSLDNQGDILAVKEFKTSNYSQRTLTISDGFLYVGGLNGIEVFRISSDGNLIPVENNLIQPINDIKNVSYLLTNKNYLWIGTENGLYQYNTRSKEVHSFRHSPNDSQTISDNHVTCMAFDSYGDLLIGTIKGIDLYSINGHFDHMTQGRKNHSLNTTYINNIMVDNKGTIWVSTLVGGVNRISPQVVSHNEIFTTEDNVSNIISCTYQNKSGDILVGVLGKGLGIRYASTGKEKIFSLKENLGISQEDVFAIEQDKRGDYWICSRFDGMIFLSGKNLEQPSFSVYNTTNSKIGSDNIVDVIYDNKRDGLWFITLDGLYFFDIAGKAGKHIEIDTVIEQPSRFFCIYLDKSDKLWLGGYGLCMISLQDLEVKDSYSATFMPYLNDHGNDNLERINSITQAADGTMFIGSNNNGFYEILDDGSFRNRPLSNPRAIEFTVPGKVTKILGDRNNNVWVATGNGIYHLNREIDILTYFNTNDGFSTNNFYINSGNVFSDDVMAFGSNNGLLMLQAPFTSVDHHNRKVRITETRKNDQVDYWPENDRMDLYSGDTSFEIRFSSLELDDVERIIYSYRIDELGDAFTYTRQGTVDFNNMKPGKYTFRVRCTNTDHSWAKNDTTYIVNVHPKFTQTFLCWSLIFTTILGLLAILVISRLRYKAEKNRELEEQIAEKTADLRSAVESLTKSNDSIEKQNVLLEEQKAKLEEYAASTEKANREKLMLYTNLTHEFKTPLSLILGPVSDLKESCKDEAVKPSLGIIERNSKYLLSLVNQILDLRKVDSGPISVKKDNLHIPSFLSIFSMDFTRALNQRNVQFETNLHLIGNTILSDRDILFKIISNLFSNALKYTPDGGKVTFNLAQFKRQTDNRLFQYISITNTGSYISEEESSQIFDLFYKSKERAIYGDNNQSSTGIGLYLVKNLVTALGGQIAVKSSQKGLTSFRVYFPIELVNDDSSLTFVEKEEVDNVPVLLLVEDNDDMRNYIKSLLVDRFKVLEATNGENGFEVAKQTVPDFIISDLMMPVCDGIRFCKMIRADSMLSHIPFLMLTALSDDDTRLNSYKEGVNAFLVKPFKKDMLLARIDNILNDRKQVQEELTYDLENSYATVNIDRSDKAFMEQLMTVLKDNYTDPEFSVPKFQSLLYMSMTPFYKKVSSLTGLTPSMLIRRYRLQTAKNLLETYKDKGISVSEIAYMVGFNDPKYFSKCFQKEYHIKPSSLLQGGDSDDND